MCEIKEYINDSSETYIFKIIVKFSSKNISSNIQKYITKRLSGDYSTFAYSKNKK